MVKNWILKLRSWLDVEMMICGCEDNLLILYLYRFINFFTVSVSIFNTEIVSFRFQFQF